MNNEIKAVVFEGKELNNYTISRNGEVVSVFGNVLSVNSKGRVSLSIDGKRRYAKLEDLLAETFTQVDGILGAPDKVKLDSISNETATEEETPTPTKAEDYYQSAHEWYEGTTSAIRAAELYETIDMTLFERGIPAVVLNDLVLDGHDINKPLNIFIVRAYTIRYITAILATGVTTGLHVPYVNEYDTYFAGFGVNNPVVVENLFNTSEVANKFYMGVLFAALPLLVNNPEAATELSEAGPLSAKSFHIAMNLIHSSSAE